MGKTSTTADMDSTSSSGQDKAIGSQETNRDVNSRRRHLGHSRLLVKSPFRRRHSKGDGRSKLPHYSKTPTIAEVTEQSSQDDVLEEEEKFPGHPRIQTKENGEVDPRRNVSEYTSLLPPRQKYRSYSTRSNVLIDSSRDNLSEASCCSASDELSSNSSTSSMNSRQYITFFMIMASALFSSFTVCLFPPFFPRIAEMKGSTATDYGLIIGTNCLMQFLVTPFVGNNLRTIGVKFAFVSGLLGGGVCCALTGFLEFFEAGSIFILMSVLIRMTQAIFNAMAVTSSFAYTSSEFPSSVASIFSITRCVMNVAQLGGPILGGLLYETGGFVAPFTIFGSTQVILSVVAFAAMRSPDYEEGEEDEECDGHMKPRKKKTKASVYGMLCIPTVWFSFAAFIVATVCNGFLSINLEPQVLRNFNLTPMYIGLFFGLKDGANSVASPIWGWVCDRNKKSVKPYLVVSSILVAFSFFLLGGNHMLGFNIQLTLPLMVAALCVNGAGISGQQVIGVVDAMHEAAAAGYPDDPTTNGLVAGLWVSLSGAGRFMSRGASGFFVDQFGFDAVSSIVCGMQMVIALSTFLYVVFWECSLVSRDGRMRSQSVTIVEQGRRRDERVLFTTNSSPSEALMNHSVHVCIPNNCSGARMATRIANSMPPKKWNNYLDAPQQNQSRSIR